MEESFLEAMWAFDTGFAQGQATQGDNQNGKGDFFNDLIALLLENCSGKTLHGRGTVPGMIFPTHNLDTSYPATGTVEILVETKVTGAPKSPRNPKQKNLRGRPRRRCGGGRRIGQHLPAVPAPEAAEVDPESRQEERAGGDRPAHRPAGHGDQ
jgi:hypothetical protein